VNLNGSLASLARRGNLRFFLKRVVEPGADRDRDEPGIGRNACPRFPRPDLTKQAAHTNVNGINILPEARARVVFCAARLRNPLRNPR
jgi:hypothetical protein